MARIEIAKEDYGKPEALRNALARSRAHSADSALLERALAILHRMGTENTGWFTVFSRWAYSDEPLRNDAANLVREAGFQMPLPDDQRLVGTALTQSSR